MKRKSFQYSPGPFQNGIFNISLGDIPNLFPPDEKMEILEKESAAARAMGKKVDPNPLALYGYFIERVKENLHVILAFSPIGDALRNRLRLVFKLKI